MEALAQSGRWPLSDLQPSSDRLSARTMRRLFRSLIVIGTALVAAVVALAVVIALALDVPAPRPAPERGATLGRVTLVEPDASRRGPASLVIEGGRIARVAAPLDEVDAFSDAYVLPGLTEMHAHFPATGFPGDEEYTALLFLLHGVTAVRLAGGVSAEATRDWRSRVETGELPGPHFTTCGPWVDGPDPVLPGAISVADADTARTAVRELAASGVDCIKAYDRLDGETTSALREAAHAEGLRVIGHVPQAVSFEDARLDDVQHLRGVHPPFREDDDLRYPHFLRTWLRADDAWLAQVVELSLRHRIAHTPTLVAVEGTAVSHDWERWRATPTMQLWLPHLRDALWSGEVGFSPGRFASAETVAMVRSANERMIRSVAALHEAGVPIHTGSDANAPNLVPGASLHRELRLLEQARLSPGEALAASTRVSAEWLGLSNPGQIRPDARADLAIFRDDPTRDLAALDSLLAVVADGRLYTREDLEARLTRYQDHYRGFAFDRVLMPLLRGVLQGVTGAVR